MIKPQITEDWVKCELYRKLVDIGFSVYPELKYKQSHVDLVVFHNDKVLVFIEVKNRRKNMQVNSSGSQYKRYDSYNIPFLYCISKNHIDETVDKVKAMIQ